MTILKLRRPFIYKTDFVPYDSPFVWYAQVAFAGYTQPSGYDTSFDFTLPKLNETAVDIASVYVNNVQYEKEASIANVEANEKTWYFDDTAQKVYVHIDHNYRMTSSDFDSLKVQGYCTNTVFYDSNNIEFLPYLQSRIKVKESADRLVYQKMAFVRNTAQLANGTSEFDFYADEPTPGADVNIEYISDNDVELGKTVTTPVYTGYVRSDNMTKDRYTLKIEDKRAQYTQQMPASFFGDISYPDIDDDVNGKVIPDGYGLCYRMPGYCTNGTITSGNVNYRYAETATGLTDVEVETDSGWLSVTPVTSTLSTGEIVLTALDARDSSGNHRKTRITATLRAEDNPPETIKALAQRELNINYTTDNYNTAQWESEEEYFISGGSSVAPTYLYMGEQKTFYEWVEELQTAGEYNFIFKIDSAGKFIFKVDDINRAVSKTYVGIDNISMTTPSARDFTDYATSVVVSYKKDNNDGGYSTTEVDTYKTTTFDKYRLYKTVDFRSNLYTESDATSKGDLIIEDYKDARNQITFTLCCIEDVDIYDIITLDTRTYIDDVVAREYLGDRKIKISSYEWDFDTEQTTITGYDITDIT